jgi:hypothetical protein
VELISERRNVSNQFASRLEAHGCRDGVELHRLFAANSDWQWLSACHQGNAD